MLRLSRPRRFSAELGWSVRGRSRCFCPLFGIYGLAGLHWLGRGLREIGIRVGLGSPAGPDILKLILGQKGYCSPVTWNCDWIDPFCNRQHR